MYKLYVLIIYNVNFKFIFIIEIKGNFIIKLIYFAFYGTEKDLI